MKGDNQSMTKQRDLLPLAKKIETIVRAQAQAKEDVHIITDHIQPGSYGPDETMLHVSLYQERVSHGEIATFDPRVGRAYLNTLLEEYQNYWEFYWKDGD